MELHLRRGVIPLCALLAVFALAVSRASAQVRCYRTTVCGGSNFFMSATVEDCCLSDEGVLVQKNLRGGVCETCVVFGWISGEPDPSNRLKRTVAFPETGLEKQHLVVGFSKGLPDIDSYDIQLVLSGPVTNGYQSQPAFGVFNPYNHIEGDINDIFISFARVGGIEIGGPTTNVPVIIPTDDVALEPDEEFTLSFEIASQNPNNLLTGSAVVIVNELQVFIVDQTELTVQFTALDYSQDEDGGSLPVAVSISAAIATGLELQIITRNLTQVYGSLTAGSKGQSPLIPLPVGFAALDPFSPDEPYIASSVDGQVARVDYDTSTRIIKLSAGPARTVQVPIGIFDDEIDEADKEYFVLLLETDDSRVDMSRGRFASRGIIRDNERTTIGFEFPEYSFTEDELIVNNDIFIIKEENRPSELTFTIELLAVQGTATIPHDFEIQKGLILEEFSPDEDKIDVRFKLIGDDTPEGNETFQFVIANAGSVPFNISRATTTVTIMDKDRA